ncbi:hypothetical protein [Arcicella aurantiaca]|nr:hypothetical protein [Arcicella aurantiaca]
MAVIFQIFQIGWIDAINNLFSQLMAAIRSLVAIAEKHLASFQYYK